MVTEAIPQVSGSMVQVQCPVCSFENTLRIDWVEYTIQESQFVGRRGHFIVLWDHPRTGTCQHLLKYNVPKNLVVFGEDWELTALDMGATIFAYPHVDGISENDLLIQLRRIFAFREYDPEGYAIWLKRKRSRE